MDKSIIETGATRGRDEEGAFTAKVSSVGSTEMCFRLRMGHKRYIAAGSGAYQNSDDVKACVTGNVSLSDDEHTVLAGA